MTWLLAHPLPPSPASKLFSFSEGGGGARSYEGEKGRSSINHSILSGGTECRGFAVLIKSRAETGEKKKFFIGGVKVISHSPKIFQKVGYTATQSE